METANYNLRIDKELRDKAFAVIESFGLSPAQAIRLFLKQTAETDSIPLSFDYHRKSDNKSQAKNENRTRQVQAMAGCLAEYAKPHLMTQEQAILDDTITQAFKEKYRVD